MKCSCIGIALICYIYEDNGRISSSERKVFSCFLLFSPTTCHIVKKNTMCSFFHVIMITYTNLSSSSPAIVLARAISTCVHSAESKLEQTIRILNHWLLRILVQKEFSYDLTLPERAVGKWMLEILPLTATLASKL